MLDAETSHADAVVRDDWGEFLKAQKRYFDADDALRNCPATGLPHEYARRWFARRDAQIALDRAREHYENSMRRYDALTLLARVEWPALGEHKAGSSVG